MQPIRLFTFLSRFRKWKRKARKAQFPFPRTSINLHDVAMLILEIVATPIRFEAEEEPQKFKRIPLNPMNLAR